MGHYLLDLGHLFDLWEQSNAFQGIPNIFVMERVFNTLKEDRVISVYPSIRKSSLRRSATGNYTIDLSVVLTESAATTPVPVETTGGEL